MNQNPNSQWIISADAIKRADEIYYAYEKSKAAYDAGDKKKVHWRILAKDLVIANELRRLSVQPMPKPKVVTEYKTVTETNWWHVILSFILGSLVVWGIFQF